MDLLLFQRGFIVTVVWIYCRDNIDFFITRAPHIHDLYNTARYIVITSFHTYSSLEKYLFITESHAPLNIRLAV